MTLNQAVILCGGQGKRLNYLTKKTPKPLLKINDTPFIEYLIKNLSRQGIKEIILLCGYLGEKFTSKYHNKRAQMIWQYNYPEIELIIPPINKKSIHWVQNLEKIKIICYEYLAIVYNKMRGYL